MFTARKYGTTKGFENMIDFGDFEEVVDVPSYRELEKKFSVDAE